MYQGKARLDRRQKQILAESFGKASCDVESEWVGWQGGQFFPVDERHWLPTIGTNPFVKGDLFFVLDKSYDVHGNISYRRVWGVVHEITETGYWYDGNCYPQIVRFPDEGYAVATPGYIRGATKIKFSRKAWQWPLCAMGERNILQNRGSGPTKLQP
jgi:hypothetical protein